LIYGIRAKNHLKKRKTSTFTGYVRIVFV